MNKSQREIYRKQYREKLDVAIRAIDKPLAEIAETANIDHNFLRTRNSSPYKVCNYEIALELLEKAYPDIVKVERIQVSAELPPNVLPNYGVRVHNVLDYMKLLGFSAREIADAIDIRYSALIYLNKNYKTIRKNKAYFVYKQLAKTYPDIISKMDYENFLDDCT